MYRNILVVLSDPRTSPEILREAIAIAQAGHGRLTLLCPIARPPAWLAAPMTACACEPLARELEQEAARLLCTARQTVPSDLPLTTVLARRPLREALRIRLAECPHDLIVLGSERIGRRLQRRSAVPLLRIVPEPVIPGQRPTPAPKRRAGRGEVSRPTLAGAS